MPEWIRFLSRYSIVGSLCACATSHPAFEASGDGAVTVDAAPIVDGGVIDTRIDESVERPEIACYQGQINWPPNASGLDVGTVNCCVARIREAQVHGLASRVFVADVDRSSENLQECCGYLLDPHLPQFELINPVRVQVGERAHQELGFACCEIRAGLQDCLMFP